jgi:hypothetical protein
VLDAGRNIIGVHFCPGAGLGRIRCSRWILMAIPSFRSVERAGARLVSRVEPGWSRPWSIRLYPSSCSNRYALPASPATAVSETLVILLQLPPALTSERIIRQQQMRNTPYPDDRSGVHTRFWPKSAGPWSLDCLCMLTESMEGCSLLESTDVRWFDFQNRIWRAISM